MNNIITKIKNALKNQKFISFLKSELGHYLISMFYFLFIYVYFYLIAEKITIFSQGFFFDIVLTIGVVSLIFFLFKNKTRNVILTILASVKTVIYIADYMYIHKFYAPASAGDLLLNFRWLDFGGYGLGLNFILVLLILIGAAYLYYIYKFKNYVASKRKYEYLFLSWMVLVPFVYATVVGLQTYETEEAYQKSDTYIFDHGLGKQIFVGEFVNTFGYTFYRYEDLNFVAIDVFYEILRWVE